jgi:enoyl-CoA hydratase
MSYDNITLREDDGISVLSIRRPKKLNALNIATIGELSEVLIDLEVSKTVRAIIITGYGEKAFVAGADIAEFAEFSIAQGQQLSQKGHDDLFSYIEQMKTPVIAAVNGFALGGGLELALSAHIRVFSENALVSLPETSLGLIPGYGGTQRLANIIGKGRAMHMILTAEMINADTALKFGLASAVFPQKELINSAKKIAKKIMNNSPNALGKAIACINSNYDSGINGLAFEVEAFGDCFGSSDFKEGTRAFLEKRKANF